MGKDDLFSFDQKLTRKLINCEHVIVQLVVLLRTHISRTF